MNILELKHVTLRRGGRTLFTNFSNAVVAGRVTAIMGSNGTGKSSLLLALAGMIPVSGEIVLRSKPLNEYSRPDIARLVAWQGDLPPTEFGLTVAQRLQLVVGGRRGTVDFLRDEKVKQSPLSEIQGLTPLFPMEVDGLLQRSLGELSSGERQRVELAALMLRDASVWLLDEPTAHLDLRHQAACLEMLRCQSQQGRAVVVVLHDIQQAMGMADDVILLDGRGHIEAGAAADMLTQKRLQAVFGVPLRAVSLLPKFLVK